MTALIVTLLIALGILLLLLEFFVIPGITFAAIGGVLLIGGGIFLAYHHYGSTIGHMVSGISVLVAAVALLVVLKSNTWNKIKLKAQIDAKVEKLDEDMLCAGDRGVCLSRLAPMGKIRVNGQIVEGKSMGNYIDEKSKVEIVDIVDQIVIVKPI